MVGILTTGNVVDLDEYMSGGPDSDRRPSPWKGDVLPTELPPRFVSESRDLNPGPPAPKAGALANCATLRCI